MANLAGCGNRILDVAKLAARTLEYQAHNKKWNESEGFDEVKKYLEDNLESLKKVVDFGKLAKEMSEKGVPIDELMKQAAEQVAKATADGGPLSGIDLENIDMQKLREKAGEKWQQAGDVFEGLGIDITPFFPDPK